jgi:hypothetical protein
MAQDDGGRRAPLPPGTNISLEFDLRLTPSSPLLSFGGGAQPLGNGFPIINLSETGSRASNVTYLLEVGATMEAPILGTGVMVEGTTSPNYDGWMWFNYGDSMEAQVQQNTHPLLWEPTGGFRTSTLHGGGPGGSLGAGMMPAKNGTGWVSIANVTIRTGMNSTA